MTEASPSLQPTALRLAVANTADLDAAARSAIIEVCRAAFQKDEFYQLFSYLTSGGRHVLAFRQDELVSHAVVTTCWLQPEGRPELKTAYVDAVATVPAHQGQGYGSALMKHLAQHVEDYAIAALATESNGFYVRLGWQRQTWRGPLAGRGEAGLIPTPHETGVMSLRLPHTPPLDLDGALSIECQPDRIW